MADAGLTHGGFYAHFKSKDDLVREVIVDTQARSREAWTKEVQAAKARGENGLEAIVRWYLRAAHRDRPEAGCSVAALAPEVARNDQPTRDVMARAADELAAIIASELPHSVPMERAKDVSCAIFALLIGTLQLARVTTDQSL